MARSSRENQSRFPLPPGGRSSHRGVEDEVEAAAAAEEVSEGVVLVVGAVEDPILTSREETGLVLIVLAAT